MATILLPIDFTDSDAKSRVKLATADYLVGTDNIYLYKGDEYYSKLLRDFAIAEDDADLVSPPIFQVKEVLICYVKTIVFQDLIDDARAPYETQEILIDKYRDKLTEAKECLNRWLSQLDENAFYGTSKGTDTTVIRKFGRG